MYNQAHVPMFRTFFGSSGATAVEVERAMLAGLYKDDAEGLRIPVHLASAAGARVVCARASVPPSRNIAPITWHRARARRVSSTVSDLDADDWTWKKTVDSPKNVM